MPEITTNTLAAASLAKILVDVVRMGWPNRPDWVSPVLAVVFGVCAALLLPLAQGAALDTSSAALAVITGILAGGSAVGITELQRRSA